ncbi:alpha/beta hydrolase [Plantactinospora sp. KLBMP9567]|uniref:alpha/beta hydrolase n=1 Tax=Plantactinospora sp. KLBMP9567 TaxID=3085900 RepID=UPI002981A6B4|nr:alpha/beta fold hydrolase [Plantactinospora sp. KLBMP9567]MDW5328680.1 alpha/beta fold hydrolase [Plantactinospora sp. KLBMP9567]
MHTLDLESVDGTRLEAALHPARRSDNPGTLVAVHGLGMDMDEGGMYLRLAERLPHAGITTLRFSFRGHGGSEGTQRSVTIADQVLDLAAAIEAAESDCPGSLYLVATGFGAVPTLLSLPSLEDRLCGLVLWQPVLDLRETFLEPTLPWGQANFGPTARSTPDRDDYLLVDGEFELGWALLNEMDRHEPGRSLAASRVPTLIVHGDSDTHVSHGTSVAAATARQDCQLHSVRGADHGFDARRHEDEALDATVEWLTRLHAKRS